MTNLKELHKKLSKGLCKSYAISEEDSVKYNIPRSSYLSAILDIWEQRKNGNLK